MRGVALGVAVVVMGLYFVGLGAAPFVDPPEGFHAAVADEMRRGGDLVTPRVNGVRYFDKPPLLYWLMAGSFSAAGPTPLAARLWSALAAVGVAAVTARLGGMLGGPRVGLLAGLMVAANLGMYLFGRLVKHDMLFILCLLLAFAGIVLAYRGNSRRGLILFYASLGFATLSKDFVGAVAPLAVVGIFFWLTRERPLAPWFPWWGVLLTSVIALPWYLLVEARSHGYLWYTVVDNHLLNVARQRVFPDEDVPLGSIEFLIVTFSAFLPWALALPWAFARAFQRGWRDATARLWLLFALWAVCVVGGLVLSPFKLPHYGLPAFPALALLAARVWDDTLVGAPGAARPRALMAPVLLLFAAISVGFWLVWGGVVGVPPEALGSVEMAARNQAAQGQRGVVAPLGPWLPLLLRGAIIFSIATVAMGIALWRSAPALGLAVALGATIAFLPAVAGEGMAQFARARSMQAIATALSGHAGAEDLVVHEGPIENGASLLLVRDGPVMIVNGRRSNLAFGATFPEARDLFWDSERLQAAWTGPRRVFLVTGLDPDRSVVRRFSPAQVRLLLQAGGRRLYSNRVD